jgi:hypothetical protein
LFSFVRVAQKNRQRREHHARKNVTGSFNCLSSKKSSYFFSVPGAGVEGTTGATGVGLYVVTGREGVYTGFASVFLGFFFSRLL